MHEEPPFSPSDRGWHGRGYLPHFESSAVLQMVTCRLGDSLPREVVERLHDELQHRKDAEPEYRRRVEAWLDAGHGCCVLRRPEAAELLVHAWRHFDGMRYRLHAWVVMPNHFHLLLEMLAPHALGEAVASWKRFTAARINRLLGQRGALWQADYWDRYIRDENHYASAVRYIHENPVKAGLVRKAEDWAWSSGSATLRSRLEKSGGEAA